MLIVGLRRAKCNPSGNQLTTSGARQPLNGYVEALLDSAGIACDAGLEVVPFAAAAG